MKRKKQFYKISKKGNRKKSCLLVPKVVIDLPFEGSWKYYSPFQRQADFRRKKKFFMNCYSEESFYAREINLESFFIISII